MPLPLSILDLAPLGDGQTSAEAIANSVDLARHAERLGYARVWYAEHHSLPGIATTAPDLMIAHVAAHTERIRLGAGGVMLPNHAPLRIAEAYRLLEAMHPGRIDLGLGRAPGTDGRTALALRGDPAKVMRNDFPEQLEELVAWGQGRIPRVVAQPDDVELPPIWLLGSSDFSARLAADRGYPYAYAAHFSPAPPAPAMRLYKDHFRPGATSAPRSMLAVAAFVADTEEAAIDLARPALVAFSRLRTGRPIRPPTPEAARAYQLSPAEEAVAAQIRQTQIVGTPEQVVGRVAELAAATRADEIMVASHVVDHPGRLRSFELLMEAWRG